MSISHVTGDLFATPASYRAHGVNVRSLMGAGIAPIFARTCPGLFEEYDAACRSGALQPGGFLAWHRPSYDSVLNLASQDDPGPYARIEWLESSLRAAFTYAGPSARIAVPWIGAGIGGLTRVQAAQCFSSVSRDFPATQLTVVTSDRDEPADAQTLNALGL